jgi:hypothetical protein
LSTIKAMQFHEWYFTSNYFLDVYLKKLWETRNVHKVFWYFLVSCSKFVFTHFVYLKAFFTPRIDFIFVYATFISWAELASFTTEIVHLVSAKFIDCLPLLKLSYHHTRLNDSLSQAKKLTSSDIILNDSLMH